MSNVVTLPIRQPSTPIDSDTFIRNLYNAIRHGHVDSRTALKPLSTKFNDEADLEEPAAACFADTNIKMIELLARDTIKTDPARAQADITEIVRLSMRNHIYFSVLKDKIRNDWTWNRIQQKITQQTNDYLAANAANLPQLDALPQKLGPLSGADIFAYIYHLDERPVLHPGIYQAAQQCDPDAATALSDESFQMDAQTLRQHAKLHTPDVNAHLVMAAE